MDKRKVSSVRPTCGHCGRQNSELKLCGRCRNVWYCNPDHQRKHWKLHKVTCGERASGLGDSKKQGPRGEGADWAARPTRFDFDVSALDFVQQGGRGDGGSGGSDQFSVLQDIVGSRDSQGLGSPTEPNLSTPLESGGCGLEATAMPTAMPPRARTPPFYHVQLSQDTRSLAENGFGPNWINEMSSLVVDHLNKFGLCVLDTFFGEERADNVLAEVQYMHENGVFRAGQVVSRQVQEHARGQIRGDKIAWVTGSEPQCQNIGQLAKLVDAVVASANKHPSAGKLADYNIKWRTKAMVACYPGRGARYVRHMDNPNGDGRCITAIYYINKDWREEHGGILRIYPEDNNERVANIKPLFDRMLFFWSDRRNPHEVLPSNETRYAITIWYLDQKEREEYLSQESSLSGAT